MKDPLVAGWIELFERALVDGRVLEIPSAPFLFNLKGLKAIDLRNVPSLTWVWRGFRVDVNGGGLLAEGALSPSRGLTAEFGFLDVAEVGSSLVKLLELEGEEDSYFNPLAWRPRAPILLPEGSPGLGVCLETAWGAISLGTDVDPLSFAPVSQCVKTSGFQEEVTISIAGFKINLKGKALKASSLKVIESSDFVAGVSGSVFRLTSKQGTLEISSRYFNPKLRVLYPFTYYPTLYNENVKANSVIIDAPNSSLAMASPKSIEIELKPGALSVHFESELLIARAGEHQALSLLVESLTSWKPVLASRGRVLLHPRMSKALAYLIAIDAPYVVLAAYNVSDESGVLELRSHKKLKSASLVDPVTSEVVSLKAFNGSLRIPLLMPYSLVFLEFDVSKAFLRKSR